jgi:hypothetical protein
MNAHIGLRLCLALVPWLAACEPRDRAAQPASEVSAESAAQGTTVALQHADGGVTAFDSQTVRFMPLMWMHLDWMARLSPAQIEQVMPTHRQMTERMMRMMEPKGRMGRGMQGRGAGGGAGSPWAALRDSIQDDLTALPGLSGNELSARTRAHVGRMQRMMVLGLGMMPGGGWAAMHGGCGILDSAGHMSAEQRAGMWAMHARMSSQMMSAMTANMHERRVVPSAEWTALRDSLTRDMAEMPKLEGDSLRSRMQSHAERMHRLMALQAGALGMPIGSMGMGCR